MNERNPYAFRYFLTAAHPDQLVGAFFFYAMGAGIVHFLGNPIDWTAYWIGQGMVLLIQLSCHFLFAYFNFEALKELLRVQQSAHQDPLDKTDFRLQKGTSKSDQLLRLSFLQAGLTTLTIGAVLTVMMSFTRRIDTTAYLLIGIALIAAFVYALPPTNFGMTGFGDLVTTFFLAVITPAFAYVLQTGAVHRLLTLLAFPLSSLTLASILALSLESYHDFGSVAPVNLMRQMGWQKGIQLHNILIFLTYLFIGGAALVGLPWALVWPATLTLLIGLFQIWQLRQITIGAKPRWSLLRWTAYGLVAVTLYLICLALWTS